MAGSAQLEWPEDQREELGMVVSPSTFLRGKNVERRIFAFTFYYNGSSSISSNLQAMVEQVLVPFARDYINYVKARTSTKEATNCYRSGPARQARKAFVVHGHDDGSREGRRPLP